MITPRPHIPSHINRPLLPKTSIPDNMEMPYNGNFALVTQALKSTPSAPIPLFPILTQPNAPKRPPTYTRPKPTMGPPIHHHHLTSSKSPQEPPLSHRPTPPPPTINRHPKQKKMFPSTMPSEILPLLLSCLLSATTAYAADPAPVDNQALVQGGGHRIKDADLTHCSPFYGAFMRAPACQAAAAKIFPSKVPRPVKVTTEDSAGMFGTLKVPAVFHDDDGRGFFFFFRCLCCLLGRF